MYSRRVSSIRSYRPSSNASNNSNGAPPPGRRKINLSNIPKGPKRKLPAETNDTRNDRHFYENNKYKRQSLDKYHDNKSSTIRPSNNKLEKSIDSTASSVNITNNNSVTFFKYTQLTKPIFEKIALVGEGTYGQVYKARNIKTNDLVALKKLRLEGEREGFPITAMREIQLLQSLNHENIVLLYEMMLDSSKNIYMVFDYIHNDLSGILNHPNLTMSTANCKFILRQVLTGLDYLHSKKIIHRDIKGSNILICQNGSVKIADFGLARKMKNIKPDGSESPDYTNRVITIWYRPPELLMGETNYGREVDVWGIGCLSIELFTKQAIFQGKNEIDQLKAIFNVMGTPNNETWPNLENLPWYEMLRPRKAIPNNFEKLYFNKLPSLKCFELAEALLMMDPKTRINSKDALKHEYFAENPSEEPLTLEGIGEWHELDAKKDRRKKRKEKEKERQREKEKAKAKEESFKKTDLSEIQNDSEGGSIKDVEIAKDQS